MSFNYGHKTKTEHLALEPRWIVYCKADDGLTYWTGETWTPSRIDAKDFGSPAEASNFAAQHNATATKR